MTGNYMITALKGFGMGAANVIPGVSGGTVALLTGIYSEIVAALDSVTGKETWSDLLHGRFREFWRDIHGPFLLSLGLGVLASIFSLAKLMTWVLAHYPILTWAFFFGLIASSAVVMFRDIRGWDFRSVLFALCGAVLGVALCTLTPTRTPDGAFFLFICGALAICTMILPGISGSFILLILGKYDFVMRAVSGLDIPVLLVFGLGCIIGLLAFAKFLHWLLDRWEKQTMLVLLGFVTGSLVKVWPWADRSAAEAAQLLRTGSSSPLDLQIPWAIVWCFAGVALVSVLEIAGRRNKS